MRTEQPKVIHLKDYQAPDYLIDETHLTFELYEDRTLVHAQLVMRRNPAAGSGLTGLADRVAVLHHGRLSPLREPQLGVRAVLERRRLRGRAHLPAGRPSRGRGHH